MLFYSVILRSKHSEKILDKLRLHKSVPGSDSRLRDDTPLNVRYSEYDLSNINDEFYRQYVKKEKYLLNIVHISEIKIHIDVAFPIDALDKKEWEAEALKAFTDCIIEKSYEIGIEEFKCDVSSGSYFSGRTRLFDKLGIGYQESWGNPMAFDLDEKVAMPCKLSKAAAKKMAKAIMGSKSLMQEIDRIYSKENKKEYYGHPVHYFISAGDWRAAEDICKVLVSALYSNGRLISGRQTIVRDIKRNVCRDERFRQVLESTEGGMAMIEITGDMDFGRFASDFHEVTKHLGSIIETTKKDTLYIIVEVMGRSMDSSEALANITGKADFVQITEGSGDSAEAKAYLYDLMDKADFEVENREEIMEYLPERETYTVTDIYKAYNAWYGSGLKNHVYKAYKEQKTFKVEVSKTESKPYEELQQMIGLSDVKALVDRILDAFSASPWD